MLALDASIHGRRNPLMAYYVYILASQRNGTLYIGMTNDLIRRVWEHRNNAADGFTKAYDVHRLVYFETFEDPRSAIQREKILKHWRRQSKVSLIEEHNPHWSDLFNSLAGG